MNSLQVSLFGRFAVRWGKRALCGFEPNKVQELLAYLLLNRDKPQHREVLAGTLWSDVHTNQSRRYLSKTLWQLQIALNAALPSLADRFLIVEADWIKINSDHLLWLDVAIFEKAFSCSQDVPGRHLDPLMVNSLVEAVNLYSSELLEGWYQEWCLYERERLSHIFIMTLDKLMDYYKAQGKFDTSLIYADRILHFDPARERTHQQMMCLYYLSGDRVRALRQYQQCAAILEKELGVKPSQKTTALYLQIRNDEWISQTIGQNGGDSFLSPTFRSEEALNHLKKTQENLLSLCDQLRADIQFIENLLYS
jgi:DNA-binding SARP family transcriptional activator